MMAIYTRFGNAVTLCDARLIPVWTIRTHGTVDFKYEKPKKVRKGVKVEETPVWHYRGWYADGAANPGGAICDGKWCDANTLRADDGWPEIEAKLLELCPDGLEKYKEWNKSGAPSASHFFPPVTEDEAA